MNEIKIIFPDGNTKMFTTGVSINDIAGSISSSLKKKAVAGSVNGETYDLNRPIEVDAQIEIITEDDPRAFAILNHSAAHLLAQAVKRLFPTAQFGVGPAIDEGFYYDIDSGETKITEFDLPKIMKEMKKIVAENHEIVRQSVTKAEAQHLFVHDGYKLELIEDIADDVEITTYTQGEFTDLCAGGHVGFTSKIKAFALLSIAGAYWRGDSDRVQLQRIYGYADFSQQAVDAHLQILEERKERDHRKLGKELDLFMLNDLSGKGLPIWLPAGANIRRTLERYIVDLELRHGYEHVYTPCMGSVDLYKTSGHWEHYHEDMFPVMEMDSEAVVLRPMTCPHHMMIFGHRPRSYRELPLRIAELGTMHRYEKSGALTGLERVRGMCLNDAHIFVRRDQIKSEFKAVLDLMNKVYGDLRIQPEYYRLSLRGKDNTEKYYDDDAMWNQSESMLREVLNEMNLPYREAEDEAAFYGPKLDIQVKSAIGHEFTLSTIQLDFLLPDRFDLTYIGEDGQKHRPVVIHRGIISTMERMSAHLIEEYKGAFPLWLAPEQIRLIAVSEQAHAEYVTEINEMLLDAAIRTYVDQRDEKLGYKIREAQTRKVPYTLIIGDEEQAQQTVSFRLYGQQQTASMKKDEFLSYILLQIAQKK